MEYANMKIQELLTENDDELMRDVIDSRYGKSFLTEVVPQAAADIKAHCQPYLKEINNDVMNNWLFRGVQNTMSEGWIEKRVRLDDRKSLDTPDHIHRMYNQWFTLNFGQPFRNAIFASGNMNSAADYGMLYMIFPKGDFSYLWSPQIEDLNTLHRNRMDISAEDLFNHLGQVGYTQTDLPKAIKTGNEIMIRSQSYYGLLMPTHPRMMKYTLTVLGSLL